MSSINTILNQNIYDVVIQAYGGLDDLGAVLGVLPSGFDINSNIPFATAITLSDTQDALANKFRASDVRIATGEDDIPYVAGDILQEQSDIILQEQTDNILQE